MVIKKNRTHPLQYKSKVYGLNNICHSYYTLSRLNLPWNLESKMSK